MNEYRKIINKAHDVLKLVGLETPIDIEKVAKLFNIPLIPYSEIEKSENMEYLDIINTCGNDAVVAMFNKKSTILYNDRIMSKCRIRWSIAHELGHVLLGHRTHSSEHETEADVFAKELLAPTDALVYLDNHTKLTPKLIKQVFKVSNQASEYIYKGFQAYKYYQGSYCLYDVEIIEILDVRNLISESPA